MMKLLSSIQRFLSKMPGFSKPDKHSLSFLNGVQFLGALNDNIYKLAVIFFIIHIEGPQNANYILSAAGAIFVVPFLLFSSAAGILADRMSKSRFIIVLKSTEIVIMVFAIFAFAFKIKLACYALLFLLSTQSAVFGPSKYGIIPELVTKNRISKANGLITSFTYLAIIIGTFLASFLTEITNYNFVLVGFFCLLVSIAGFFSSFGIKHTPPIGTKKKINFLFIKQIYQTLAECKDRKHLLVAIYGSAYFLFIGAFTQLNVIPFAIEVLGLTEVAEGYLFLVSALGIALGAVVAGKASRSRIELGITVLSGLLMAAFFFVLGGIHTSITWTAISLFVIGFCGGNFVVPFDTFIQLFSPENNRGHVIAATNFLSFVGVLLASIAIFVFNELLGLTPAQSFGIIAAITALFTVFLLLRLSDLFLSYTARKILHKFIPVKAENLTLVTKTKKPLLMLEEGSFLKAWLLCGLLPNLNILVPQYKVRRFPWFQRIFYSLHRIDSPQKFENLVSHGKIFMDSETIPCIYLLKKKPVPAKQSLSLTNFISRKSYEVITVNFEKTNGGKTTKILFTK